MSRRLLQFHHSGELVMQRRRHGRPGGARTAGCRLRPGFGAIMLLIAGCTGDGGGSDQLVERGLGETDSYLERRPDESRNSRNRTPSTSDIAAYVNGEPISFSELRDDLSELGGNIVLRERTLDRLLTAECSRRGIAITEADIEREREALLWSIGEAAIGADEEAQARLVEQVRRSRGLGPVRFEALLRRNAQLRKLVAEDVNVNDVAIEEAYELKYGPKYEARLITVESVAAARRAIERIRAGESFATVAAEVSTDPTRARGGLLEPISPADASYPMAVRRALERMNAGEISDPIALEDQFAIVRLERRIPAGGDAGPPPGLDAAQMELAREVRLRQERLLMSVLAERLLGEANVTVRDDSLGWSWGQSR